MKILYAGVYNEYLNPTERNYLIMMKNLNATFYGPGFTNEDTLENGINHFIEANGGYDFIITTTFSFEDHFFENFEKSINEHTRYRYTYFPKEQLKYIKTIKESILKLVNTKIIYIIGFDPYSIKKDFFNILKRENIYTILLGKQFISSNNAIQEKEKFSNEINDNYYNFINEYDHKIISFYHIIGENEFKYNVLVNRKYDISVMGVLYTKRKHALKELQRSELTLPSRFYTYVYSLLNKAGLKPFSSIITLYLYNIFFQYYLFNSKISYTSGSELKIPVRKFFEIPAHGTLLLAVPCNGFKCLGFKKDINYIEISPNDNLIEVVKNLLRNNKKIQNIADNGQDLIFKNHTTTARSQQLNMCLKAIMSNSYHGSYWENGKFKVRLEN